MNYRILIADDEEKIIQLILQLGHWDALGIEIVSVCTDGEEALARILELKPDIVLTDIKMPVIDGIEMIQRVKEQGISSNFIVISGYRHFEYAKSAISLGVVDYLLKPLSEEQLNRTLEKTCALIDSTRKQDKDTQKLQDYVMEEKRQANETLIECLIEAESKEEYGNFPGFSSALECNARYQTEFFDGCFLVVSISSGMDALLEGANSMFAEKTMGFVESILGGQKNSTYLSHVTKQGIVLVLNFDESSYEKMKDAVSALFYRIQDLSEIYGSFALNIGISACKKEIALLPLALHEAFDAEWGRYVMLGDAVVRYAQIMNFPRFGIREVYSVSTESALVEAVQAFNFDEAGHLFQTIFKNVYRYENHYPGDMRRLVQHISCGLLYIHREQLSLEEKKDLEIELRLRQKKARNFQQLIKETYLYIEESQRKILQTLQAQRGKTIEDAKLYIMQHFAEALSLEELAGKYELSPAYFSRLFKLEAGMGFNDYVTQVRLDKSKEFLANSRDSVKEIARRVGYMDDKYFSKLFKKTVGIKPTDYRKLYGK